MSAWQCSVASFALLGLSACFVDAGKSTVSGAGSTTGGTPSTAEPTTAEPMTTSTASTAGPTSGTTQVDATTDDSATGDQCREAGDACEDNECCGCLVCVLGTCLPNDGACGGECRSCDSQGICNLAGVGATCQSQQPAEDCTTRVWGVEDGACYAFGVAVGKCDSMGKCEGSACSERGEEIVECPECMLEMHGCLQGTSVREVGVANFCVTAGNTPACQSECDGDDVVTRSCDPMGTCQETEQDCGDYLCAGGACTSDCVADSDCSGTADCIEGKCV
jgi:hypothetical protein